MTSASAGVCMCVAACLIVAACGGESHGDDEPSSLPTGASADEFEPPPGEVVFDLEATRAQRHPAVDAYVAWQTAATKSLRERVLAREVTEGAAASPVRTVERSLSAVQEGDFSVPKRMVGRLETVRPTRRAAILDACLWAPSFDYRDRETGRRITGAKPRWMGVEVRMTRRSGQDGRWIVAGLSTREDCEGNKP